MQIVQSLPGPHRIVAKSEGLEATISSVDDPKGGREQQLLVRDVSHGAFVLVVENTTKDKDSSAKHRLFQVGPHGELYEIEESRDLNGWRFSTHGYLWYPLPTTKKATFVLSPGCLGFNEVVEQWWSPARHRNEYLKVFGLSTEMVPENLWGVFFGIADEITENREWREKAEAAIRRMASSLCSREMLEYYPEGALTAIVGSDQPWKSLGLKLRRTTLWFFEQCQSVLPDLELPINLLKDK